MYDDEIWTAVQGQDAGGTNGFGGDVADAGLRSLGKWANFHTNSLNKGWTCVLENALVLVQCKHACMSFTISPIITHFTKTSNLTVCTAMFKVLTHQPNS